MKRTESAGGVVINLRGEVLVVSQHGTTWSLPKGHLETGEDPLQAAHREILEETGVEELELIAELGSYSRYKLSATGGEDRSELKTIHLFLFVTKQEALRPIDPDNPEARWVDKTEAAELLSHPLDREYYRRNFLEPALRREA
jgi:ADP-ribose pyrophosphatase YjhB (NUDIX family)